MCALSKRGFPQFPAAGRSLAHICRGKFDRAVLFSFRRMDREMRGASGEDVRSRGGGRLLIFRIIFLKIRGFSEYCTNGNFSIFFSLIMCKKMIVNHNSGDSGTYYCATFR